MLIAYGSQSGLLHSQSLILSGSCLFVDNNYDRFRSHKEYYEKAFQRLKQLDNKKLLLLKGKHIFLYFFDKIFYLHQKQFDSVRAVTNIPKI
jgi:hypothetical protein